MDYLIYSPGQTVTIFLETTDGYNNIRTDGYPAPVVSKIYLPDFTLASNYPQNMVELSTGLFYFKFVLPTGATAVGSYLVDVTYMNPADGKVNIKAYQIIVNAPYGNFGTTIG